jgi:hypothetical protein
VSPLPSPCKPHKSKTKKMYIDTRMEETIKYDEASVGYEYDYDEEPLNPEWVKIRDMLKTDGRTKKAFEVWESVYGENNAVLYFVMMNYKIEVEDGVQKLSDKDVSTSDKEEVDSVKNW